MEAEEDEGRGGGVVDVGAAEDGGREEGPAEADAAGVDEDGTTGGAIEVE